MSIVPTPESDRIRFWAKVEKTPTCWLWTAARFENGYGAFRLGGKQRRAHIVAHEWLIGPTSGLQVCHTCDVKHCVRPEHLFLGTQSDNIQDMFRKGRERERHGEASNWAKLTETQVREIYDLYSTGLFQQDIAEMYGITQVAVSKILRGTTWEHLSLTPIRHQTLSDQDALEIRRLFAIGESRHNIAHQFGVSLGAVDKIKHRRTFRHLP